MANTADKEGGIIQEILLRASAIGARLFRQNTGVAWQGDMVRISGGRKALVNLRPLRAGLCVGSSDVIGWTPVEITPDMVGRTVAVFTAIEVKTADVRATDEQIRFCLAVAAAGGIAAISYSHEEALAAIKGLAGAK